MPHLRPSRVGLIWPRLSPGIARPLVILLGVIAGTGLPALLAPAAVASTVPPHITAKPHNVMVDHTVSLVGVGFPVRSKLTLEECSETIWPVPQNPCLTDNSIRVRTDSTGGFKATMKAEICPAVSPPTGTERTCYIGEPLPSGVDTITLVGAARITVSWP